MKPTSFEYVAPASVAEAVQALGAYPEAKVLAGGQSLVPLMNFRLARPQCLVDINRLDELRYVRREGEWLAIGALTVEHEIGTCPVIVGCCPILTEATRWIGHPAIRHRGTIGGSIAHNDPNAEYPLVAALLGAEVVLQGPDRSRRVPFGEFSLAHFTTDIAEDEIVTEVRVPVVAPGTGWAFLEVARRQGDFALVSAAVTLRLDGDVVREARIAVGGVGPTPLRVTAAESLLRDQRLTDEAIEAAAAEAATAAAPQSDLHASADFRRQLCHVLAVRGLQEAQRNVHS